MKRSSAWPPPNMLLPLLVALLLVITPHLPRLPIWMSGLCITFFLISYFMSRKRLPAPAHGWILLISIIGAIGIFLHYGTLFGRDAGIALLIVMMSLKLLELRGRRDVMIVIFLGFFLIVGNFLYAQTFLFAAYLIPVALLLTANLVAFSHPAGALPRMVNLKIALKLFAEAVPLVLILFFLFPRVPGPLWGMPSDARGGKTGLSDSMTPGGIAHLANNDSVAFRVQFEGPAANAAQRYWRGPVLDIFDGQTWHAAPVNMLDTDTLTVRGRPLVQHITLEPHGHDWMFALDLPQAIRAGARIARDGEIHANEPITQRTKYTVVSYPEAQSSLHALASELSYALQLPEGVNPRAAAMARRWRQEEGAPGKVVLRALNTFHREPFRYTREPPPLGVQAVDDFMFHTRSGFCEHYAGAFTFMMRAAGIPARVVTGYQGGEYNPLGEYWIVRQSDAHAWAEVWLAGQGWVRVDPTSAVSPERVDTQISSAPLISFDSLGLGHVRGFEEVRWAMDAANNHFNQWVVGFETERQIALLARLGMGIVSAPTLILYLVLVLSVLILATGVLIFRRKPSAPDEPRRLYQQFCRRLAKRSVARLPNEGPLEFGERVKHHYPEWAETIERISQSFIALRYGQGGSTAALRELRQAVRNFKPR